MSAARKFAPSSQKASRWGVSDYVAAGHLAGRDFTSRPALFSQLTPEQCQYAEGTMPNSTRKVLVNAPIYRALNRRVIGPRRKIVARELGVSEETVKKLRQGTAGVSFETIQAICQRDPSIRALVIQSLGPVAEIYPDAVEQVLRGR